MYVNSIAKRFCLAGAAVLLTACSDSTTATAVGEPNTSTTTFDAGEQLTTANVLPQAAEPFTFRAPLDPYRIHDLPDFMVHSNARTDIAIQRLVFAPGAGGWHTHPGPTFIIVAQGQIKLTRHTARSGCVDTPVFGPGEAYFEVGNEVHRATVLSAENAVLHVVRFNVPVGGAITNPAEDPGC